MFGKMFYEQPPVENQQAWLKKFAHQSWDTIKKNIAKEIKTKEKREAAERIEKSFVEKIVSAYAVYAQEKDPVVLWDLDDTLGSYVVTSDRTIWKTRPSFNELGNFLRDHFPQVKNGILSDRPLTVQKHCLGLPLDEIEQQNDLGIYAQRAGELHGIVHFFDQDSLFTSDQNMVGEQLEGLFSEVQATYKGLSSGAYYKVTVLENLKHQGKNIKMIDDLNYIPSAFKEGVCVRDERPTYLR